jgi:hypothetical protein
MKDYSRKQHNDYQYRDWLGIKTSKSIWNSILVQNPGHAEFSNMREDRTSLDAAIADFLRQSELKKPYKSPGFTEMEDVWEGPPGGFNPLLPFDQPWNLVNPVVEPWTVVFDLISQSTYCPGETRDFVIRGTEPIYLLELSFERPGTSITVLGGYGTNEVIGTITADEEQKGSVDFNGSMTSVEGTVGSSNYLMPLGRDCCDPDNPMVADPASTPETIARSQTVSVHVLKGSPPYTWSKVVDNCVEKSDAFFTLGSEQTEIGQVDLTAAAFATGAVEVQCVDTCGTVVIQEIRCTTGSWQDQSPADCEVPGDYTFFDTSGFWMRRVVGCKRNSYRKTASNSDLTDADCDNCGASPYSNPPECVTWDCIFLGGTLTVTCEPFRCAHPSNDWCLEVRIQNELAYWV